MRAIGSIFLLASISFFTCAEEPKSPGFEPKSFAESGIDLGLVEEQANSGDASAQQRLGEYYVLGYGVEKDYEKARYWLKLAAEADYAPGMASYAQLYLTGRGVELDRNAAKVWLNRASAKGHDPSTALLEVLDLDCVELGEKQILVKDSPSRDNALTENRSVCLE